MDEYLQSFGYFHTKMAFSRVHLQTNWFSNFLILLRVKQHVYGEHKLKFWIKNIHEFQNCCSVQEKTYFLVHLLGKRRYHDKGNDAVF